MKYFIVIIMMLITENTSAVMVGVNMHELLNNSLYIVEFEITEVREEQFVIKILETLKGEKQDTLLVNQYPGHYNQREVPYAVGLKGVLFIEANKYSGLLEVLGGCCGGEIFYNYGIVSFYKEKCTPEQVKSAILEYFINKVIIGRLIAARKLKTYKTSNPYMKHILKYLAYDEI